MADEKDEDLWTAREAAEFLSRSVSWVYQAASMGELPSVHVGRALRFRARDVRAYAEAQRQQGQ